MAYDSESDKIILLGGWAGGWTEEDTLSDTWAYDWDSNTWTEMAPPSGPGAHQGSGMAYDAESDRVIMFGGDRVDVDSDVPLQMLGSTWAYDFNTNTWEQMNPPESPSPRIVRTMVYDAKADRIILWGGWTAMDYFTDTWAYDFNTDTWTEMTPPEAPPGVHWPAMAYDAESDVAVTWGVASTFKDHVWVYDFNADLWSAVETKDGPARRDLHTMVYDAESDRIIMYGGQVGRGDIWAYDYNSNTWTKMQPDVSPGLVDAQSMAYNSAADRVILFGGGRGGKSINETWAYDFNTDTWKKMAPYP